MREAGGHTPRTRHEFEGVSGHAFRLPAVARLHRLLPVKEASTVSADMAQVRNQGSGHRQAGNSTDHRAHGNLTGAHESNPTAGAATRCDVVLLP